MENLKKKIQNFWNKKPCNVGHSKKTFLSKEYFDEVKKKRFFVEPHIKTFADFKTYKNKNVLEIGFGIGTDAIEFVKSGAKYYGLEYSKNSLEITKKRIDAYNLNSKNPVLFYGDAENISKYLPRKKMKFDLIYSFGVLHHTPNMQKCFKEIYKISDKNTVIKIMLYSKFSYKSFMLNTTNYRYEAQKGVPVATLVNDFEIIQNLNKKFKILSVKKDFIFPYLIKPYKKNIYKKIKHFKIMPQNVFNSLKENIGEHLMITMKKK
tara:strand:+ start:3898 stop:4689 length:792 start_codon:yes stop_codon:yes gene_type:complete